MKTRLSALAALLPLILIILTTLPADFIRGTGEYWDFAASDRSQSLSGYLYFVTSAWSRNLLFIPTLSIPGGEDLINSDSIVLLALLGKLFRSLSGILVNPFGAWYVACWLMNGVAAILILRQQGIRDLPRLAAAAVIVGLAPFWLERWYHFSLVAHFLLLLSFHAYLMAGRGKVAEGLVYLFALALSAALVHIYIWCMVMLIMAATVCHVTIERRRLSPAVILSGGALGLLSIGFVYLAGYLSLSGSAENIGYMSYTTNLLSPFYSNHSAFSPQAWTLLGKTMEAGDAWPFFSGQRPDATAAQYVEGCAYLGAGTWALVLFVALKGRGRGLLVLARRNITLLLLCLAALAFAVSPYLTFGPWTYQLWQPSDRLLSALGAVRASGRFFWIPGYLFMIAAIVLSCRVASRQVSTAILVFAALLQMLDTTPVRIAIGFDARHGVQPLDVESWNRRLSQASSLIILPSFECGGAEVSNLKAFVQGRAAQLGQIPTNSASQSRTTTNCATEFDALDTAKPDDGNLYLFFDGDARTPRATAFIRANRDQCESFGRGTACLLRVAPQEAKH